MEAASAYLPLEWEVLLRTGRAAGCTAAAGAGTARELVEPHRNTALILGGEGPVGAALFYFLAVPLQNQQR